MTNADGQHQHEIRSLTSRVGVVGRTDNLVTNVEPQNVGVLPKRVDRTLVLAEEAGSPGRRTTIDTSVERKAHIKKHIDTGGVKSRHAGIVVERRVNTVYTDSVDMELREERNVTRAVGLG